MGRNGKKNIIWCYSKDKQQTYFSHMSNTITIPFFEVTLSINTLIAIVLLLAIFFTFFSVTVEIGGTLTGMTTGESSCNQVGLNQLANWESKLDPTTRKYVDDITSELQGSSTPVG